MDQGDKVTVPCVAKIHVPFIRCGDELSSAGASWEEAQAHGCQVNRSTLPMGKAADLATNVDVGAGRNLSGTDGAVYSVHINRRSVAIHAALNYRKNGTIMTDGYYGMGHGKFLNSCRTYHESIRASRSFFYAFVARMRRFTSRRCID